MSAPLLCPKTSSPFLVLQLTSCNWWNFGVSTWTSRVLFLPKPNDRYVSKYCLVELYCGTLDIIASLWLVCILIGIFPLIVCWYNMLQCDFSRTKHLRKDFSNKKSQQLGFIVWRSFAHTLRFWNVTQLNRNRLESWKHCCFFYFAVYHRIPERYFVYLTLLSNFKWISELMERPLSVGPTFQEAIWNNSFHGIWVYEVSKTFVFFHRSQKCWLALARLQFSWLYA